MSAPDQPLKIPAQGLAKVEDLRLLIQDLGPRMNVRSGHTNQPGKPEVPSTAPTKTLRYFQPDKTTGVAKTADLRRVHTLLLKALPAGNKTPFRARRQDGTLHRSDIHAFHRHWLAIAKRETTSASA